MRKFSKIQTTFLIIITAFLLGTAIYNFVTNREIFFSASLTAIVADILVLYVSFYLTQSMNDRRENIRHVENILNDIEEMVLDDAFFKASTEDEKRVAMIMQRRVGNKIDVLKKHKLNDKVFKYVEDLERDYNALREFYSDHMSDIEYLNKSVKEIANYREKIEKSIDQIIVEIV